MTSEEVYVKGFTLSKTAVYLELYQGKLFLNYFIQNLFGRKPLTLGGYFKYFKELAVTLQNYFFKKNIRPLKTRLT